MSKIIIGIHGLGNKPPKKLLQKWWKKSIAEGLTRIGKPVFWFRFKIVYWADILHPIPLDPSVRDSKNPSFIEDPYIKGEFPVKRSGDKLTRQILDALELRLEKLLLNNDMSINYSSISDIIVKNYFKDLNYYYTDSYVIYKKQYHSVRNLIRGRLIKILKKYRNKDILLIAHSMGSIIAFNVLSDKKNNIKINHFYTIGSPLGIPIVRSKIYAEHKLEPDRHKRLKTPDTILRSWHNFSDLHDKIALNYNLEDDYLPNSIGIRPVDNVVLNDYYISGKRNPHKAYGYLRTKEMSDEIYWFLTSGKIGLLGLLNKIRSRLHRQKTSNSQNNPAPDN